MNLVIGSCFRNAAGRQIQRYIQQLMGLQLAASLRGDKLHVISVWGDCDDTTPEDLGQALGTLHLPDIHLIERSHGLPAMGSVTHPDRLRTFAWVANGVFEAVPYAADAVIYVESDLIWDAETLYRLVDQLKPGVDVIAPLTFAGDAMYDIWGCREPDGTHLTPFAPYGATVKSDALTLMSSVGSCVVMTGRVARTCRCTPEAALVGFCEDARRQGYAIWLDARERIDHPV